MVRHVHPSRVALSAVLALGVLLSVGALPASALTQADLPAPLSLMAGSRPYVSTDPATGTTLVVVQSGGVIVGQLYDTDFAAIGAAIPISTGGSVENPSAEWDPENNRWLVVWDDEGDKTVDGRIVAVDGSFLTAELLIADQDLNGETLSDFELAFASYAADQDGYLVAFKATTQTSFCQAAFVSWVAADGTVPTTAATPVRLLRPHRQRRRPRVLDHGQRVDRRVVRLGHDSDDGAQSRHGRDPDTPGRALPRGCQHLRRIRRCHL
jgi:hypothetical protein